MVADVNVEHANRSALASVNNTLDCDRFASRAAQAKKRRDWAIARSLLKLRASPEAPHFIERRARSCSRISLQPELAGWLLRPTPKCIPKTGGIAVSKRGPNLFDRQFGFTKIFDCNLRS